MYASRSHKKDKIYFAQSKLANHKKKIPNGAAASTVAGDRPRATHVFFSSQHRDLFSHPSPLVIDVDTVYSYTFAVC